MFICYVKDLLQFILVIAAPLSLGFCFLFFLSRALRQAIAFSAQAEYMFINLIRDIRLK